MKCSIYLAASVWMLSSWEITSAFQLAIPSTRVQPQSPFLHAQPRLFMSTSSDEIIDASMEEEIERIFQEEKAKTMKMSRFSNEKGMEYAPWMNMTPEDEARIRTLAKEKTLARRKRQQQEQNVRGSLLKDSTNQELSGTGLQYKIIDGDSVELEWSTDSEPDTKGYLIKRRAAKTTDFVTIASYETFAPLNSKGVNGGTYRYLDENVGTGTSYMYRITEKEGNGDENDLSQCLVEIQSASEKQTELVAIAGFAVAAIAVVAAGLLLDPVQ